MPARPRPLSPHLQIYRWQIGNSLSILHRATGVALAFGLVALSFWLVSLAGGAASYRVASRAFQSPIGLLFLVGWSFAFFYHLLNGVRHLFWDAGLGFERRSRHASGWFAVVGAVVATAALWALLSHWGRL
ncbi:MAG TPA: succinate dehydrogenase, cytochrome b556 subunit [Steroidobacteraceae bacterium]|jgi:succinate dehydrogenase / fumarate reductase cytochrome b subunit|nr:succinate dehydrogenase, cytochrome b556 subunit [Steroidobacteraceae bacterium]